MLERIKVPQLLRHAPSQLVATEVQYRQQRQSAELDGDQPTEVIVAEPQPPQAQDVWYKRNAFLSGKAVQPEWKQYLSPQRA